MRVSEHIRCTRVIEGISGCEEGSNLIELALLLPMFLFLFVGAVDLGRAYYVAIEVAAAAQAGALYGVANPSDTTGIQTAASQAASNLSGLSSTATYGCECSDGSSAVASCTATPACTYNYVSYVDVVSTAQYVPIFKYPGLPSNLSVTREARMRVGGN